MFMHRSSLPARVLLLALVLLLGACGKPKEAALPSGTRVLALGDSLTAPHGVTPEQAWPTLLAAKTGWAVVNAGVSGDTSAGALPKASCAVSTQRHQGLDRTRAGCRPRVRNQSPMRRACARPSSLRLRWVLQSPTRKPGGSKVPGASAWRKATTMPPRRSSAAASSSARVGMGQARLAAMRVRRCMDSG